MFHRELPYISNSEIQKDFGVWNITYQTVLCQSNWAGSKDSAALGSVTNLGPESVCCPANPTVSIKKKKSRSMH